MSTILVTGGAGYIGTPLVTRLLAAGHSVRVLDALLHGQEELAADLESRGAEVLRADVRDATLRERALDGAEAVVHLAAIVGDPACARDPALATAVNTEASAALVADAGRLGVRRLVFASTCSNYGRMADPTVPITEDGTLSPVSLYAEQKVGVERLLLERPAPGELLPTCLRFATVYGVAPRMRFDLTVNEFARDLWADRDLEVFGEQFWRPYVHVIDAGRAIEAVLAAPEEVVGNTVLNVGDSGENYTKQHLVDEVRRQCDRGRVSYVSRQEDPRDYKVDFARIGERLGWATTRTVPDGIGEVLAGLDAGAFGDPDARRWRNT